MENISESLKITDNAFISMKKAVSAEITANSEGETFPVLECITLSFEKGESWGIYGTDNREIKALCRMAAGAEKPASGQILTGSPNASGSKGNGKKIFFINSPNMLSGSSYVLEELMLLTCKSLKNMKTGERQLMLLEKLAAFGMKDTALMKISGLRNTEKLLIILLASAYSSEEAVICDFTQYKFSEGEMTSFERIASLICGNGKLLIVGTSMPKLIETAFEKTAFIKDGRLAYSGGVRELIDEYDNVVCSLKLEDAPMHSKEIGVLFKDCRCELRNGLLYLHSKTEDGIAISVVYDKLIKNGINPSELTANFGSVENSFAELVSCSDI